MISNASQFKANPALWSMPLLSIFLVGNVVWWFFENIFLKFNRSALMADRAETILHDNFGDGSLIKLNEYSIFAHWQISQSINY